jgi:signal transduction histidine kinase
MQDASHDNGSRRAKVLELISTFQRHLASTAAADAPAGDDRPEVVRYLTDALERQTTAERRIVELSQREQSARAEAKRSLEENRAKDRFLAQLSHELRTPLQPVLAAASALLRDPRIPPDLLEEIRTIQRNVQLEARLIDDLLDVTKITSGKLALEKRPINVHSVIARSVEICEAEAIEKRLSLSVDLKADHTWVAADPGRLQQILWNLIKNAVKFTPAGGTIIVRTRNASSPDENRIIIEVEDSGIGIEPHVLPHIFDAFEQGGDMVTQKFGGLGLGLAISKVLADRHEGTLEAKSDGADRGATFTLTLPSIAGPAQPPAGAPRKAQSVAARALRLLLVDDDHDSTFVLARLLQSLGHDVAAALNCAEALAAAESREFDLMICDLGLPDGNGLDLLPRLRTRAGIKAIALTGYGTEDDVRNSLAAGFDAHLTKPITLEQLVITIDELLPPVVPN